MRITRTKRAAKILKAYKQHFGLRTEPLEVFVDSIFARQALSNGIKISESIASLVPFDVKLVTSTCILKECEHLGSAFYGPKKILEQFKLLVCKHPFDVKTGASQCIRKRIQNSAHAAESGDTIRLFALASNDSQLRRFAGENAGTPVFYISHKCVNIEPIPLAVEAQIEAKSKSLAIAAYEKSSLELIKDKFGLTTEAPKRKRKKAKQPNPLSCKKAKKAHAPEPASANHKSDTAPKRKVRMTWAMQQALSKVKDSSA